jgi:hypothetical protein
MRRLMSNQMFEEIIRRAKFAVKHMGTRVGGTPTGKTMTETPVWSLAIELPNARVTITWIESYGDLRIRAMLPAFGHWGSVSVLDLREEGPKMYGYKETWHNPPLSVQAHRKPGIHHYAKLRADICKALRNMMVLDDLANV